MSELKQEGTIHQIGEVTSHGSKGFTKKEFLLSTQKGKFPQVLKFELIKDNTNKLDAFNVGDDVTVSFDLKGSEYNGKHYVTLTAWKIVGQSQPQPQRRQESPARPAPSAQVPVGGEGGNESYPF